MNPAQTLAVAASAIGLVMTGNYVVLIVVKVAVTSLGLLLLQRQWPSPAPPLSWLSDGAAAVPRSRRADLLRCRPSWNS